MEPGTGDLLVRHDAASAQEGVWGVSWWIADIPLQYAILVPGSSGVRLTADTPQASHQFDYPMLWEAQLVVVEGPQGGFYIWAEDTEFHHKRLVVERRASGWRLGLYTINEAPFDSQTACRSVTWRLNTYAGDWRVAARRYRDWFSEQAGPVPIAQQRPGWVKDIRGCVIMPTDRRTLELLPAEFDPEQTLLYLYDWRQPGYDRNYPDYEHIRPTLMPFVQRAHELKFRVMLHVNYFGVDPLHPLYEQFEQHHVRSPWGKHEKEWWVWPPEDPDIRFAYINPASRAWRDLFTSSMVRLCQDTGIDALHLDQTLCIYNDYNGRIDGMSMMEGNIALHKQLREALPDIALSGEGLNEVTCRYEAFAQRHVWGIDHAKGTYDRRMLAAAHPISSYILRPFTVIYGYLGYVPPEDDQRYAAWNEAYRHWGVIPTLKPTPAVFSQPTGFSRQFLDELHFWQQHRVDIDFDGPWPSDVILPLRTADGRPFVAMRDGRWMCLEQEVSRTITGVSAMECEGTIPDWRAYDERHLLGLDPDQWYPYFPQPRNGAVFHICKIPPELTVDYLFATDQLAVLRLRDATPVLADLTTLLGQADVGTRPAAGPPQLQRGSWETPDGGTFTSFGDTISAHPPWKVTGSGETFARFRFLVPREDRVYLATEVFIDPAAIGEERSDGVTFFVRATDGARHLSTQYHQETAQPHRLELDLTPLAGRQIELELAVHPGPKNSPTYDWARWRKPRIERDVQKQTTIGVTGGAPWTTALAGTQISRIAAADTGGKDAVDSDAVQLLTLATPATICLLRDTPANVQTPIELGRLPDHMFFIMDPGKVAAVSQYAGIQPGSNVVGGVPRKGLLQHPPNHGRTVAVYVMTLPDQAARFTSYIGLRDGSKSEGVRFSLEINGSQLAQQLVTPGPWQSWDVDVSPWAGEPIVLALITDSAGPFNFDWAVWGEPRIVDSQ